MKNLIKKILLQEVEKKYSKPTPNVEKLIYDWLDNYFDGAKMYQIKQYEFSYTFEWCNNGMEIARFSVDFNHNYDVWDDARKTSERDFDNSELWIPKDIVNDLQTDIPVRRNYLRYVIEEWFEDTMIEKIQSELGRNDISMNSFSEHPEKSQVCVPPVSKPEGVTEEDMIEHILKTTLFKRNDILKHEDEKPGWIEKIYLEKLRQKEDERLNG